MAREATAFAVITGGGTTGHVMPALAIADALVAAGHRADEIVYIGAKRGIETRLLPRTDYPHHFLEVSGFQRSLSVKNLIANVRFPFRMMSAVADARRLLKRLRPAVVVNVGGYASFPATRAARALGIPIVVVSYDRVPGRATRVSARYAAACAVAFEGSRLPKARYTGAPVRRDLVTLDRAAQRTSARDSLGIPQGRFVVAAFGGSLGSKVLNDAVTGLVEALADRSDLAVRHVVGDRFLAEAAAERSSERGIMYRVIGYEDRMVDVYAAADLMITRAGASTIAELATAGMPSIIIPWAASADDHQSDNARILGEVGAATVIPESELSAARLTEVVRSLIDDPIALAEMAAAAYAAGEMHRSGRLVALIEEVAGR
jgi:UDP-N-acetylglucosamine--N-acetylmuramyl-(pentapeptide) pyrophosphoryl-undecaprenol N-acetylglucosamine transferase